MHEKYEILAAIWGNAGTKKREVSEE